jgi:hypothetical protein
MIFINILGEDFKKEIKYRKIIKKINSLYPSPAATTKNQIDAYLDNRIYRLVSNELRISRRVNFTEMVSFLI